MNTKKFIQSYWDDVLKQNKENLATYFHKDAYVRWHDTNEHFNVEEFIIANCEYPGEWLGNIRRIEEMGNIIITVVNVYDKNHLVSFHVVSFISLKDNLISSIDEYWGEVGEAPKWRQDKKIGTKIIK